MKVPAKGKAVMFNLPNKGDQICYSMGVLNGYNELCVCVSSLCDMTHVATNNWQEVDIVPVVHVPEEGVKVYGWDTEKQPESPTMWYSNGELVNGALSVYAYKEMGTKNDITTVKHWEEIV